MTPFLQLRLWWRRAPYANKLATTLTLTLVVALAAWILVPTGGDEVTQASSLGVGSESTSATGDTAPATSTPGTPSPGGGDAVSPGVAGPSTATSTARTAASADASGTGEAATGCLQAPSGTPGITDKTVMIAVGIVNLAGPVGNSAAGIGSPDELKGMAQAVANDINARGGVQCRKIELKFYEANPLNADQVHAVCLQMAEDRPFVAIDFAAFSYPPGAYVCLPQQKVPLVDINAVLPSEIEQFAPYLTSVNADLATALRNVAYALKERGWFDPAKGFNKLGLLYSDCSPEVPKHLDAALAKVGITPAQTSKYVLACPSAGFSAPNELSQAVTQHRLAGVTHVIPITGGGDFNTYTEIAERQGFRPKYALTDYQGIILTEAGNLKANLDNFDRSIAITTTRYGQESTPGFKHDPGTLRCQAILVKAGFPPNFVFQKGGGMACSLLWNAEAAIKHARALTREAVLPGLFNAGPVQFAWPLADATYRAPLKLTGGDTWWPIEYHRECGCWHVLDANRRPSYEP